MYKKHEKYLKLTKFSKKDLKTGPFGSYVKLRNITKTDVKISNFTLFYLNLPRLFYVKLRNLTKNNVILRNFTKNLPKTM